VPGDGWAAGCTLLPRQQPRWLRTRRCSVARAGAPWQGAMAGTKIIKMAAALPPRTPSLVASLCPATAGLRGVRSSPGSSRGGCAHDAVASHARERHGRARWRGPQGERQHRARSGAAAAARAAGSARLPRAARRQDRRRALRGPPAPPFALQRRPQALEGRRERTGSVRARPWPPARGRQSIHRHAVARAKARQMISSHSERGFPLSSRLRRCHSTPVFFLFFLPPPLHSDHSMQVRVAATLPASSLDSPTSHAACTASHYNHSFMGTRGLLV
jgi:hypothetical protein